MDCIILAAGVIVLLVVISLVVVASKTKMATILPDIPSKLEDAKEQFIPRHIYQTMKSTKITAQMKNAINSWVNLNPEYTYHYYDDLRCQQFIADHFDRNVLTAYDSLVPGAYKADLWRYCVLYVNGGVYIDVDMIDVVPLREIIDPEDEFVSARDQDPRAIFNAFICSVPQHPFLKTMIDHIVYYTENRLYGASSLEPTGPLGLGKAIRSVLGARFHQYPIGDVASGDFRFKLLDHPQKREVLYYKGRGCIKNKYPEYEEQKKILGQNSYHNLWLQRKIYKY